MRIGVSLDDAPPKLTEGNRGGPAAEGGPGANFGFFAGPGDPVGLRSCEGTGRFWKVANSTSIGRRSALTLKGAGTKSTSRDIHTGLDGDYHHHVSGNPGSHGTSINGRLQTSDSTLLTLAPCLSGFGPSIMRSAELIKGLFLEPEGPITLLFKSEAFLSRSICSKIGKE